MDLLHSLELKKQREKERKKERGRLTFPLLSIQTDPLNRQHSLQLPRRWITRPEIMEEYHPPPPNPHPTQAHAFHNEERR